MNGGCCMTDANGQEYPGGPLHDSDCPSGGGRASDYGRTEQDNYDPRDELRTRYNYGAPQEYVYLSEPRFPQLRNGSAHTLIRQLNWDVDNNWIHSLYRFADAGLTEATMGWLIGVTQSRTDVPASDRWKFFCGCCWSTIRTQQQGASHERR